MKINTIYRYFWPDNSPYGRIVKLLLTDFCKSGHDCFVLSGYPSYNKSKKDSIPAFENINNIDVQRFKTDCAHGGKLIDFFIFYFKSFFYLMRNKGQYDLLIVNSFPPVMMGFYARFISRVMGIPYIYHVQDVHPEFMKFFGKIKQKFIYQLLRKIDKRNCQKAVRCVTLSNDMAHALKDRGYSGKNIRVINNPSQSQDKNSTIVQLPDSFPNDKFVVLFAGNIGRFQNLEPIIESARLLKNNNDIVFVFMGEGSVKKRLMSQASELINNNVLFLPYQPADVAGKAMRSSSLGLVSLMPGLSKLAYPSKIPTLLGHGCPILLNLEKESEIAKTIGKKGLGFILPEKSPDEIATFINKLWKDSIHNRIIKNKLIQEKSNLIFSTEIIYKKWQSLLLEVESEIKVG